MLRFQIVYFVAFALLCHHWSSAEEQKPSKALNVIESNRGGRHWVDEKTAPPKSPEQSLAAIEIESGYEIELFASEPLVRDPVAICFDRSGRMYVAEYSDYPIGPAAGEPPLSKIVVLEDTDADGRADKRQVFADHLDFAHSMMAFRDGLLVGAKTEVLYLRDRDGDGKAEIRETLFDGFTPAHPQMQIGNPRWGIDNWVYLNYGPGEVASSAAPNERVKLPRKDFQFDPRSLQFRADSGMGQFGNTIDRWGHRYYCTNRNPVMSTLLSPHQIARNPYHIVPRGHYDVAPSGGESKVYPLVAMKSNYLSHAGTHTSACGTTAYLGSLGDESFHNSVFVCEPIGHLVTRSIVDRDKVKFTARRAAAKNDFIASTDTWFRPSSLASGPDDALYLADMYRLWVEHPKFLPKEIADKLDWRAGEDRGRIYRIVPQGTARRPFQPPENSADAVKLLDDNNGWRQFLGQRLLVEQQAIDQANQIRKRLDDQKATTRLHAIWTLDGLDQVTKSDVVKLLDDPSVECRIAAAKLAQHHLDNERVFDSLLGLAADPSQRVRFQVALSLGASSREASSLEASADVRVTRALVELSIKDAMDPTFADGLLTSARDRSGRILAGLVESDSFIASPSDRAIALVKNLASVVGARGDINELNSVLALAAKPSDDRWWRSATVAGLGTGLPRYRGELGRLSLPALIANPPKPLSDSVESIKSLFTDATEIALSNDAAESDRIAAIELMGFDSVAKTAPALRRLLRNDQPQRVQTSAMQTLTRIKHDVASSVVLDSWSDLGPSVRQDALALLLRRVESTQRTLDAMSAGEMNSSALTIDQRVRLLKHSNEVIRQTAEELFGGAVSKNRVEVAKQYESALALTGNFSDGKSVFKRVCASCHRIDGEGQTTGPDLSDVRNRSKTALLYDILDPNSKVEPRFTAYSVLTLEGDIFTGLIESENSEAIILKMAEGKSKAIGRAEVDQLKASDVSLMPEGVEKDITPQQMADLLSYLKDR